MAGYRRSIDKNQVLCSSDMSGTVSFSVLTEDMRLELGYKVPQAHFGPVKRLLPIGKSPFVITFVEEEPIKVWNTFDKYLCLVVNQYRVQPDVDCCLVDDNRYIGAINVAGVFEMHSLEFANNTKNILAEATGQKKKFGDLKPHSSKIIIECANRIELPFFSVLIVDEQQGMQLHICHITSLDTVMVKVGGLDALGIVTPSMCDFQVQNFKNVKKLERYDQWEEYYSNVKVLAYDPVSGDLIRCGEILPARAELKEQMRSKSIGTHMGRPIFLVDLSKNPPTTYLVDIKGQYLCKYNTQSQKKLPTLSDSPEAALMSLPEVLPKLPSVSSLSTKKPVSSLKKPPSSSVSGRKGGLKAKKKKATIK